MKSAIGMFAIVVASLSMKQALMAILAVTILIAVIVVAVAILGRLFVRLRPAQRRDVIELLRAVRRKL